MNRDLGVFAFTLACIFLVACGRSSGSQIWPVYPEDPLLIPLSDYTGTAPFDFMFDFGIVNSDTISLIEIDFGESEGYSDVTDICLAYRRGSGIRPVHQYLNPGSYSIKTKVTLTTGEVFEHDFGIPITVLPPDEGGGA